MITRREVDEHLVTIIEHRYGDNPEAMEKLQGFYTRLPWTRRVRDIGHIWVTIGLPKGNTPEQQLAAVTSLTPRVSQLVGARAVIEFHPHPHVHILGLRPESYHKGNLIKVISRALKLERQTLVDIKMSTRPTDYKHRQDYLAGTKKSTEKQELVSHDSQLRTRHGIPDIILL